MRVSFFFCFFAWRVPEIIKRAPPPDGGIIEINRGMDENAMNDSPFVTFYRFMLVSDSSGRAGYFRVSARILVDPRETSRSIARSI